MKTRLSVCLLALFMAHIASVSAVSFPGGTTPFSQYGQIQNVQGYSSNPFWNPNAAYNQRMPQPIYAQGADLNTAECQQIVAALVSSYCGSHNRCIGVSLDDARPELMVQLTSLPNHNYSGCAGYLDAAFDEYKTTNSIAAPTGGAVAFPTATTPNPNMTSQNTFPTQSQYANDTERRRAELQQLQAQNGANNVGVVAMDFPKTAADATFEELVKAKAAGYEPFKDQSAYTPLNLTNVIREIYDTNNSASGKQSQSVDAARKEMIDKIATALKEAKK